jgi:hypothetical protein
MAVEIILCRNLPAEPTRMPSKEWATVVDIVIAKKLQFDNQLHHKSVAGTI